MKGKLKRIFAILIFPLLFFSTCLSGCELVTIDWDINSGFDTEEYFPPDYDFTVKSDKDNLTIKVSNVGDYGETAKLVSLRPYSYLSKDTTVGLSQNIGDDYELIGDYDCGTAMEFKVDRYDENNYDNIYKKYYVISSTDDILAGPMYCTEFEPLNLDTDPLADKVKSKKGVMCEDDYRPQVADLGCSYTDMNFWLTGVVVPNEIFDKSTNTIIPLEYEEKIDEDSGDLYIRQKGTEKDFISVYSYIYNGKKYYFRRKDGYGYYAMDYYDTRIKKYTDDGVKMTLIMVMNGVNLATVNESDIQYIQPYFMTYEGVQTEIAGKPGKISQVNTSNEYGAGYWGALMEFLVDRYSRPDKKYGIVNTYVIGNEIDLSSSWNRIVPQGQPALTLENYCEEYERQLRIANNAIKKFFKYGKPLISLTHWWTSKGEEYAPKEICDFLTRKTLEQGNYDWGFAIHPYGAMLPRPDFWQGDLQSFTNINGSLNTAQITWTNLEVMELYLEQPAKLYNGQIRSVYLTEGGVSSSAPDKSTYNQTIEQQAAGVAYAYYKAIHLKCVEAIIYYRLIDNIGDGAYFGLFNGVVNKPAYYVYKYIDTKFSYDVSNMYLNEIEWSAYEDGRLVTHSVDAGNVSHYSDTMALVPSKFDWSKCDWDLDYIAVRQIDEEYPEI